MTEHRHRYLVWRSPDAQQTAIACECGIRPDGTHIPATLAPHVPPRDDSYTTCRHHTYPLPCGHCPRCAPAGTSCNTEQNTWH